MMKKILSLILAMFLLATPCFATEAKAAPPDERVQQQFETSGGVEAKAAPPDERLEQQLEASGGAELFDETPEEAKGILNSMGIDKIDYKTLLSLTPTDFFKALWGLILTWLKKPLVILASIMGVAVLCSLIEALNVTIGQNSLSAVFNVVAVLCVCAAVVNPIVECVRMVAGAIQSCADFILSFIPVFVSLVAVGGQPVSATTYNAFLLLTAEVLSNITANQLVPLVTIYLAFCIVGAFTPNMNLSSAANTAKTVVTWGLGLVVTMFVGLLGVQSLVASGADTVAMKTGKFLVGSFIPVVGKALSDALTTAQSCVKLLKTTVGAYAVVVAVLTFLPSLLQTLLWYFAVSVGSAISDILGAQQIGKVLKACGTALSLLIAILTFVALLFIVSITIMLIVGMGVA